MKQGILKIDIARGRGNEASVRPFDTAGAVRVQAVILQGTAGRRLDIGYASMTSVAEEEHKALLVKIEREMIAGKATQADGAFAHPGGNFAQMLVGVLGEAEKTEVLPVCSVPIREARAVLPDGTERSGGEQFAG